MNSPFLTAEGLAHSCATTTIRVNDLRIGWQNKPIAKLMLIKGVRGYSWLYWSDGTKQLMAYTIKHYGTQLPIADFIRVHQNCLVNRAFVQRTQLTHRGPIVRLYTGIEIAVSRRRWSLVKKEFQDIVRQDDEANELANRIDLSRQKKLFRIIYE